jgi:hypothetical protein
MRNAPRLDDMAEQMEIGEIEPHGDYLLILRRQATQKAYCNALFLSTSFVIDEVMDYTAGSRELIPALRCGQTAGSLEADNGRA